MVKTHMKEILTNQFAHIYPNSENFLASERWFYGFLKRSGYSLQRKMKIGQKLPIYLDEKLWNFNGSLLKNENSLSMNFMKSEIWMRLRFILIWLKI